MKTQTRLLEKYMQHTPIGRVEWLGVRPEKKQPLQSVDVAQAIAGAGLDGDHRARHPNQSSRQLTLLNLEDLTAIQALMGLQELAPERLRRNVVISGLNLYAMRYQRLQIGAAQIEVRAHCHPCVRMESTVGKGALLAMFGHAGFCAVITQSGEIRIGDTVTRLDFPPD